MNEKINILDVKIDDYTAKEAMKKTVSYMKTEPINIVEMVTVDTLMRAQQDEELQESMKSLDMILAGEKEILEAAEVTDYRHLQEVETKTFLKMFFRFLHKNHCRIFVLVETDEEVEELYEFLSDAYSGIQIAGMAKVSEEDRADDLVVNAVNGDEVDCVLAALSAPVQEKFAARNKSLLNARVWLGVGKTIRPISRTGGNRNRFMQFLTRRIFKREIQKNRKEIS